MIGIGASGYTVLVWRSALQSQEVEMKRCLKSAAILSLVLIVAGCATEVGYNTFAKGETGVGDIVPLEQLNPSATTDYSMYSFYARDKLTAARDTCPGKTWCENQQMLDAIDLARTVLGRAYGPPVGKEGARHLANTLRNAETALYGKTTVKDVHRYE